MATLELRANAPLEMIKGPLWFPFSFPSNGAPEFPALSNFCRELRTLIVSNVPSGDTSLGDGAYVFVSVHLQTRPELLECANLVDVCLLAQSWLSAVFAK